jgi:hypothetical protein
MCRIIRRFVIAALVGALETGSATAGQPPAAPADAPLTLTAVLDLARANSQ